MTEVSQHPQGGDPKHVLTLSLLQQTFTPKLVLLDLSDISCVQDVAKEVLDCYGCVDILINNASVKVKGPAHKISLELDKKIMDANYFGPITFTKGPVSLIFPLGLWTTRFLWEDLWCHQVATWFWTDPRKLLI